MGNGFWKRFGTPVYDAPSGTVHEFRRAYDAWQQHRRPQIMVYFNKRLSSPKTSDEAEQWRRVLEFREQFPKAGIWWPYQGKTDFANKVRQHLTRFLQHEVLGTVPPGTPGHDGSPGGSHQGPGATTVPSPEARRRYLECLHRQCQSLPLAALGGEPGTAQDLTLDQVYIALNTTTQVAKRAARDQLVANLEWLEAEAFRVELQEALSAGRCLLVLDGLDEVPPDSRPRVRSAVMALLGAYRVQRVIITCRVRSYVGDAVLPEFQAHTLSGVCAGE